MLEMESKVEFVPASKDSRFSKLSWERRSVSCNARVGAALLLLTTWRLVTDPVNRALRRVVNAMAGREGLQALVFPF